MADSEYYIQIFLFVATILCYIVLAVFVFCAAYHCCKRCILKTKRKRQNDNNVDAEQQEQKTGSYFKRVELLDAFHKDEKSVMIVPNSKTSKNKPTREKVEVDNSTSHFVSNTLLDERNHFIDKKYHDIFQA